MVRYAAQPAIAFTPPRIELAAALTPAAQQAGRVLAALGISAAGWLFVRRIAGRSGLL
jgi:hypothetical protein